MAASGLVPLGTIMTADGNDPRLESVERFNADRDFMSREEKDQINGLPMEVYHYYAEIERKFEDEDTTPIPMGVYTRLFHGMMGKREEAPLPERLEQTNALERLHSRTAADKADEKEKGASVTVVTESERFHAYRALRLASWQGIFFLITTDILGPSTAPYAFALTGYGGGILSYFLLWVAAVGAGQILWRLYLKMDSRHYPVKNFSDLGERLFGRTFRHICSFIQSLQLLLNVALLILGNGVTLSQIVNYKLCFAICNLLWWVVGVTGGQIRSLKNIAWFCNWNVWLNIVVIIMTIVGCSIYAPIPGLNYPNLTAPYPPITHAGFKPDGEGWYLQVAGVSFAVFAYGGAMIFVEFMAEMRRPRDFWKSAITAQCFIFICYMIFGIIIYHYQGQYSFIIPALSIANYGYLLAVNIIGLFTIIVAAVLYANIGVKIFYYNVLQAYFKAPDLITPKGRIIWTITVFLYWSIAYIFGSAVPNLSAWTTFVGSVCILQFTYTFPPLMYAGYLIQCDAMKADRPWEPGMPYWSNRIDTWRDMSRWKRGYAPRWWLKSFLILIFLSSMAFCGLGAYSGIEQMIVAYRTNNTTAFSCHNPSQPSS